MLDSLFFLWKYYKIYSAGAYTIFISLRSYVPSENVKLPDELLSSFYHSVQIFAVRTSRIYKMNLNKFFMELYIYTKKLKASLCSGCPARISATIRIWCVCLFSHSLRSQTQSSFTYYASKQKTDDRQSRRNETV